MATQTEAKFKILKEIIDTERNYINSLNDFLRLTENAAKSSESLQKQRAQIQEIINISSSTVKQWETKTAGWDKSPPSDKDVANLSNEVTGFLLQNESNFSKTYPAYAANYDAYSQDIFQNNELKKINATLPSGKDLASLAIQPVQRVPRYRLLLEELSKKSDPSEKISVDKALTRVKAVGINVNEAIRAQEALQAVNTHFKTVPPVVKKAVEGKNGGEINLVLEYAKQMEALKAQKPFGLDIFNPKRVVYDELIKKTNQMLLESDTYIKSPNGAEHTVVLDKLKQASTQTLSLEELKTLSTELDKDIKTISDNNKLREASLKSEEGPESKIPKAPVAQTPTAQAPQAPKKPVKPNLSIDVNAGAAPQRKPPPLPAGNSSPKGPPPSPQRPPPPPARFQGATPREQRGAPPPAIFTKPTTPRASQPDHGHGPIIFHKFDVRKPVEPKNQTGQELDNKPQKPPRRPK